jgi:hypothetical protein
MIDLENITVRPFHWGVFILSILLSIALGGAVGASIALLLSSQFFLLILFCLILFGVSGFLSFFQFKSLLITAIFTFTAVIVFIISLLMVVFS